MSDVDLDALERKARAATPGPWRWADWRVDFGLIESDFRSTLEHSETHGATTDAVRRNRADKAEKVLECEDGEIEQPNAEYIAAVSPDVVLKMISRIRQLEEELSVWHDSAIERGLRG